MENIPFSEDLSEKILTYLGLLESSILISKQACYLVWSCRAKSLFLLLMDENLAEVLRGMSLGEDKTIIIPEDDAYCAIERGGRSILGRLLNPDCQNMGRMLRTMPKVWKVYERVRGITLTREKFQFIFDLETDIQMVLRQGFWTFEDWGLAMERWVESPPPTFLQTAKIWVRLSNIPGNYLTLKTIDAVADGIGHVKLIEFDPLKPHLLEYVRVQVILDVNQPLRDKKSLTLPGGRIEYVDVEYERVRKKCFHCFRLSHEKQKCPLLREARNKGKGVMVQHGGAEAQTSGVRQHHTDLIEKLMPLMAPTIPPGFEPPSSIVVPEVFEQMRLYMDCNDPDERRIREFKMRKTLQELSNDPIAQRSCLRLEGAPLVSTELNQDWGRVFDFSRVNGSAAPVMRESLPIDSRGLPVRLEDTKRRREVVNESIRSPEETYNKEHQFRGSEHQCFQPRGDDGYAADREEGLRLGTEQIGGFVMGADSSNGVERSTRSRNSHSNRSSWVRRKQSKHRGEGTGSAQQDRDEGSTKRKAQEEGEVSSKMAKQVKGSMVSQKPSNAQ